MEELARLQSERDAAERDMYQMFETLARSAEGKRAGAVSEEDHAKNAAKYHAVVKVRRTAQNKVDAWLVRPRL